VPCGERAALAVADVLRDHVDGLRLSPEQAKAAAHILACRIDHIFQPNMTSVSIVWAKDGYRDLRCLNSMGHYGLL